MFSKLLSVFAVAASVCAQMHGQVPGQKYADMFKQHESQQPAGVCDISQEASTFFEAPSAWMAKKVDEDTIVRVHTLLPCGGDYEGVGAIQELLATEKRSGSITAYSATIHRVDPTLGHAIASITFSGTCARSGNSVSDVKMLVILKWTVSTCRLKEVIISAPGEGEAKLQEAYFTRAEKLYAHAWDVFTKRSTISLDESDPIFDLFSDDVQVKITTSPTDLMPITEAKGKCELVTMMKANWLKLMHVGDSAKELIKDLNLGENLAYEVLFADEEEVILIHSLGQIDSMLHVIFNDAGLISYVHRSLLNPIFAPLLRDMPKVEINKIEAMDLYFQALETKSALTCSSLAEPIVKQAAAAMPVSQFQQVQQAQEIKPIVKTTKDSLKNQGF